MKILLTGCSASQASESLNSRLPTFPGLLKAALSYAGHDVVFDSPSMSTTKKDLETYDYVVVGLSAPTSVSSYRLYGALSTIDQAKEVTNLVYLVDAPEPHKLWNGIRALAKKKEEIVKPFYSRRPDYDRASDPKELSRIHGVLVDLYESQWNKTIVPAFPWTKESHISAYIPRLDEESVFAVCLDSILLTSIKDVWYEDKPERKDIWVADQKTKWTEQIRKTISKDIEPMALSKWPTNSEILERISSSLGSIITTYKNGDPWWSVNLSQSLFTKTPVITDWKHTHAIGKNWSYLPHQIEDMSLRERTEVSENQKFEYTNSIKNLNEVLGDISRSLFIS